MGDELTGHLRIVELGRPRHQFIRAVLRLCDRPASDETALAIGAVGLNEILLELWIAACGGGRRRETRAEKAQRQIHCAPGHLFDQHMHSEPTHSHAADFRGKTRHVVSQLVRLFENTS